MGKKRIVKKGGEGEKAGGSSSARAPRRKLEKGMVYVEATYNNTKMGLADEVGNIIVWSSSGLARVCRRKKRNPVCRGKSRGAARREGRHKWG